MAKLVLLPANICIYCQSEKHDGSHEHIVPEGLNGRMELPNATCAVCKDKINQVVEGPLQELYYKRSRLAFGYKSKRRGRRQHKERTVVNAANSWSLVAKRNLPPFEMVIPIELPDLPVTYVQYFYPAPPFLLVRNPEMRNTETPVINHPQKVAYMKAKAAELVRDPVVVEVSFQSPTVRMDLVARLASKIACGAFFLTARDALFASPLGRFVVDGGSNALQESLVFSASNEVFPMKKRELRVFEVQENGGTFLCCAVNLMPEAFKDNYFVRIPALQTGALVERSWDYADPDNRLV